MALLTVLSGARAAATNPLLALNPTFLLAGASPSSIFAQNSDGSSTNTADGQVTGYVQDLTTNASNGVQTVTNNKAFYYTNNGIKGFRSGFQSGQRRWIAVPASINDTCDLWVVHKSSTVGANIPISFRNAGNLNPVSAADMYAYYYTDNIRVFEATIGEGTAADTQSTTPAITRYYRSGGTSHIEHYSIAGSLIASATIGKGLNQTGYFYFGSDSYADYDAENIYLALFFDSSVASAGDKTTILAHIASYYGALS